MGPGTVFSHDAEDAAAEARWNEMRPTRVNMGVKEKKIMKRLLFALSIFSLFLAACATPAGPVVVEVTPTPVPPTMVPPTPTHIPVDVPRAQRAAIAALAAQFSIPVDQISVISSV